MHLVAHIGGDGDLVRAWLEHYQRLGVTVFHLIVHGPPRQNERLLSLTSAYPIVVEQRYEGPFLIEEKGRRLRALFAGLRDQWVVFVDSDEFLELPYRDLAATVRALEAAGANALYAPLLQRLAPGGRLDSPEEVLDPSAAFPLCSQHLCLRMWVLAYQAKYPLFRCTADTRPSAGSHAPPSGKHTVLSAARGVSHHYKWRQTLIERLNARATSAHRYRHESESYLRYLEHHDRCVPVDGAFTYSRAALAQRGLLRWTRTRRWVRLAARSRVLARALRAWVGPGR